jgi:hypothetical protein
MELLPDYQTLLDYKHRAVRLTNERLAHILIHPEMTDREASIVETLKSPRLVRKSQTDASVELIYRFYTETAIGDKWLCVVAKYFSDDAFIVTAYFTDKPKRGEVLWQNE